MSKKTDKNQPTAKETSDEISVEPKSKTDTESALAKSLTKKDERIKDLERRLERIEKRTKSNERFARTFSGCLDTQVLAIDAVTDVMRRSLREDVIVHEELMSAIKQYDRHKVRRWFSGFFGVLLWVASVMAAACVGAFIYWVYSGK